MEEKKTNGFAIAGLVLGILSILSSFTIVFFGLGWLGLIFGIVGIVMGVMAKKKAPSGMATAGLVLSIIGTVLCGITFIACVACIGVGVSTYDTVTSSLYY